MDKYHGERSYGEEHDIVSKQQRIVGQRSHRSPSHPISRTSHREVRTSSSSEVCPKLSRSTNSSQRSQKCSMHFCPSSNDLRDEHLERSKDREYQARERDEMENHGGGRRKVSSPDLCMGCTPSSVPSYYEKLNYTLDVSNICQRWTNGEAEIHFFQEFKRYGQVKIKVEGFGKGRHAFITFTRMEHAMEAFNLRRHCPVSGQNLDVTWSRETVNQHPEVMDGIHPGDRRPVPTPRNYVSSGERDVCSPTLHFNLQGGKSKNYPRDSPPPRSSSCGANYSDISSDNSHHSYSRSNSLHDQKDLPCKGGSPHITDPNVTRTLFVGNLGCEVTERELCDLFKPYGSIECVDIKIKRAINTSYAYAFVKFRRITDAMNAKEDMHETKYGNGKLNIGFGKGSPWAKVWIGNLSGYADLSEISSELGRFGLIRRIEHTAGKNCAIVHFERLDNAQTAVNSLTRYRFKNTNLPLKIDIIQPIPYCSGSECKDFEDPNYCGPVMSIGETNNLRIHSHVSPDLNPHPPITRRGKGRTKISESGDHARCISDSDSAMDLVVSSSKGSYQSDQGRKVVTEVRNRPSYMRPMANDDLTYSHRDSAHCRKRRRSPGYGDDLDDMNDIGRRVFRGWRRNYQGSHGNESQRLGNTSSNEDFEFGTKKPRNCSDSCRCHKQHRNPSSVQNVSHVSMPHRVNERSMDHSADQHEDYQSEQLGHRGGERSSGTGVNHRSRVNEKNHDYDPTKKTSAADSDSAGSKDKVDDVSPPPPPPTHPSLPKTDMRSHKVAYSALKLGDSTGTTSFPDGMGQTGSKPDLKPETLADLSPVYPVIWHGNLVLKETGFPTQMHLIGGDPAVAELLVKAKEPGEGMDALRITHRMHLEPPRLEEFNKRMANEGHCILLALPSAIPSKVCDGQESNSVAQLRPLKSLLSYLKQRKAAGLVALNTVDCVETAKGGSGLQQKEHIIGSLYAFPMCEFSQVHLRKVAPHLGMEPAKDDYLLVVLLKETV